MFKHDTLSGNSISNPFFSNLLPKFSCEIYDSVIKMIVEHKFRQIEKSIIFQYFIQEHVKQYLSIL